MVDTVSVEVARTMSFKAADALCPAVLVLSAITQTRYEPTADGAVTDADRLARSPTAKGLTLIDARLGPAADVLDWLMRTTELDAVAADAPRFATSKETLI